MVALAKVEELKNRLKKAQNLKSVKDSRNNYLDFIQLMHPHRQDVDDYTKSAYEVKDFHKVLAEAVDMVERGEQTRIIISLPPRNGKTETCAKKAIPYYLGKHPHNHVIYATYGLDLSKECGEDVKHTMNTKRYKEVFPGVNLRKGGSAKDRIQTEQGGVGVFVGRGGAVSGKGAHLLIVDDLVKDAEEARSESTMEACWQWYNKVATMRLMDDKSAIIIIMTRWGDNDVIGRILDPESPNYDAIEADRWYEIKMSALCEDEDNDPMGRRLGEPLWAERFSKKHLEGMRRQDPIGFACLQQQNPTPEDGMYFRSEYIKEYQAGKEPKNLRIYAAADYACSTNQNNDSSCMIIAGVDPHDNIWLLDCWWYKMPTDKIAEAQLNMMRTHEPITWWMESGHISKSMYPFLRKRMEAERVYCPVEEVTVSQDKKVRAQSIKGYMSMGKVYFPKDAFWFAPAVRQILRFGGASRHDDFIDAISLLGMKLNQMVSGARPKQVKKHKTNTFGAFKEERSRTKRKHELATAGAGF